ncbi:hypothetical protein FJTKL_13530 [Diaporthe vaccinii]|uniref:Uncharacterized protein n=1 Tax=Diaporthe vaccinii TaxID=105482 RepID=A0ABR4EAE8_9PEZI
MAHACRYAHELLLRETQATLRTLPAARDLGITAEMTARFRPLAVQMYGKERVPTGYFVGPQNEEGKDFEAQVWGDILALGPLFSSPPDGTYLRSYVLACSWPWSHKAPDLQYHGVNRSDYARYASGGYSGYLLNPPAPVWDQWRPVEVEFYHGFLQEAWWQGQFSRFGHQALKLSPSPNALLVMPTMERRIKESFLRTELGVDDFSFIQTEAYPRLYHMKQNLVAQWLWQETEELVIGRLLEHRLGFEARTWGRTYARINTSLDKSLADIGELGSAIDGWLADSIAGRLTADAQATATAAFNQAATTVVRDDLMVVERNLRYSTQYAQALIAMYSLLSKENDRRTVHQKIMTPLRERLMSTCSKLDTLTQRLDVFAAAAARVDGQNFLAALLQGFGAYTAEFAGSARVITAGLVYLVGLLADELVAPGLDYALGPGSALPAVPEARKRLTMAASLRRAAQRPLRNLRGEDRRTVVAVVRRWAEIILVARNAQADLAAEVDAAMEVDANRKERIDLESAAWF